MEPRQILSQKDVARLMQDKSPDNRAVMTGKIVSQLALSVDDILMQGRTITN